MSLGCAALGAARGAPKQHREPHPNLRPPAGAVSAQANLRGSLLAPKQKFVESRFLRFGPDGPGRRRRMLEQLGKADGDRSRPQRSAGFN